MKRFVSLLALLTAVLCLLPGCSAGGRTMMEYQGEALPEKLYSYWMSSFKRNILNYYEDVKNTEEYWNSIYQDDITVGDYFTDIIDTQVQNYLIAHKLMKQYHLSLSADVKQSIQNDIDEKIEYYGSRSELNESLGVMGINIDLLKQAYTWMEEYNAVTDYLFGDEGPMAVTAEQVVDYYEKNYSRIHYLVLYTTKIMTDEDGNYLYDADGEIKTEAMTEEEIAAVTARAEEAMTRAQNGEDFPSLIAEYSDYNAYKTYPGGLFVSENDLSTYGYDIVGAVQKAVPGDIVRVQDDYAIFIIKELELTPFESLTSDDQDQLAYLTQYCTEDLRRTYFESLAADVVVREEVKQDYTIISVPASPSSQF